ncbi:MAG: hypothetical protein P4L57_12280 [Rhizomicrobium sp.]|nr:hypothetical protein [Rhizomicrobium sp.]
MQGFVIAVFAMSIAGAALAGTAKHALPSFEATTQCMLGVLRSEPHVANPTLVGSAWNGRDAPYIEYAFSDETVTNRVVRFTRRGDRNHMWFQAVLPGLLSPGEREPPYYGADHIAERWKIECHVDANILTV